MVPPISNVENNKKFTYLKDGLLKRDIKSSFFDFIMKLLEIDVIMFLIKI